MTSGHGALSLAILVEAALKVSDGQCYSHAWACDSNTHWSVRIHVHFKFYKCFQTILCDPWTIQTALLWQRHKLYWSEQRAKNQHHWSRADKLPWQTGLHEDFQRPPFIPYGRLLGETDRSSALDSGRDFAAVWHQPPHTQTVDNTDGRSPGHFKCQAVNSSVNWSWQSDCTDTCNYSHSEIQMTAVTAPPGDFDRKDLHTSQWKQVQCLEAMETGTSGDSPETSQVDWWQAKHSSGWCSFDERQSGSTEWPADWTCGKGVA